MSIEGSYRLTVTIDGHQVAADAGLFRDGFGMRALEVYFPVTLPVALRSRDAHCELLIEFDPKVEPVAAAEAEPEAEPDDAEPDADADADADPAAEEGEGEGVSLGLSEA